MTHSANISELRANIFKIGFLLYQAMRWAFNTKDTSYRNLDNFNTDLKAGICLGWESFRGSCLYTFTVQLSHEQPWH